MICTITLKYSSISVGNALFLVYSQILNHHQQIHPGMTELYINFMNHTEIPINMEKRIENLIITTIGISSLELDYHILSNNLR